MEEICQGCGGLGWYDVGDCEDGVTEECPACLGTGMDEFEHGERPEIAIDKPENV